MSVSSNFIFVFILWFICNLVFLGLFTAACLDSGVSKNSKIVWIGNITIFTIITSIGYNIYQNKTESDEKIITEEIAWRVAKCPTYQSECGSKAKYSCERKAAVVGRNLVGDIFVQAYATCN